MISPTPLVPLLVLASLLAFVFNFQFLIVVSIGDGVIGVCSLICASWGSDVSAFSGAVRMLELGIL